MGLASANDALARAKRELSWALEVPLASFEKRRDFELNALEAANDVCDWVFSSLAPHVRKELANAYLSKGEILSQPQHLVNVLRKTVVSFRLARDVAIARKHAKRRVEITVFTTGSASSDVASFAFARGEGVQTIYRHKIINRRTGERHRATDVAADLIRFWDDFLSNPIDAVARRAADTF
ncbi:MAG: hypothetical protein K2P94_10750 [Rhodospirillaceae bacterium]|nr:hypothetical protein [Rhodospirillaceae bacterium]